MSIESWSILKKEWNTLRDIIEKNTKELSDNEISIATLENNIGENNNIDILKDIVKTQKESLHQKTKKLIELQTNIQAIRQSCIDGMRTYLEMYNDILCTIGVNNVNSRNTTEVSKALYDNRMDNSLDNHQLRPEPPINGIHKIDKVPDSYTKADSIMDNYFLITQLDKDIDNRPGVLE